MFLVKMNTIAAVFSVIGGLVLLYFAYFIGTKLSKNNKNKNVNETAGYGGWLQPRFNIENI